MLQTQKLLSGFDKLTPEHKKKKILAVLDVLKTPGDIFSKLHVIVSSVQVETQVFDSIYQLIMRMVDMMSNEKHASTNKAHKAKLQALHKKEKMNTADLEGLLTNI